VTNPLNKITGAAREAVADPRATADKAIGEATRVVGAGTRLVGTGARLVTHVAETTIARAGVVLGRGDGSTSAAAEKVSVDTPPVQETAEDAVAREQEAAAEPPSVPPSSPEATADPDSGVTTPSGIPAAGPGVNPDTTETDLHQPDTEPLVDPATVKAVKKETDTMRKGAERDKG
jgi:hypothetical protein